MKYRGVEIRYENGWYKADVWKRTSFSKYLDTVMADSVQGIKKLIRENQEGEN